jgi:hypothetical protein
MTVATASSATLSDYRTIARRYADAWNAHDVDAIMALHSDDTFYHLHGEAEAYHGREAVTGKFTSQLGQVPDIHFELKSLHGGAGHFVFEAEITYSRNGRQLKFDGIDLITIRDGLVVGKNSYMVISKES